MRGYFCSAHLLFFFFLITKSSDLDCFFELGKETGERVSVSSCSLYFGIEISTMILKVVNVAPSRHVKKLNPSQTSPS